MSGTLRRAGFSTLCAAMLFANACTAPQPRSVRSHLPAAQQPQRSFAAYTWNERGDPVHTNVFHASQPLGFLYVTPRTMPENLQKHVRFRVRRDDVNEVFYRANETILEPQHTSRNNLGNNVYSYSFESAGMIPHKLLWPAKQYRVSVEYWSKGKDPRRFRLKELAYLIPGINMVFVYADDRVRRISQNPILAEQTIKILD